MKAAGQRLGWGFRAPVQPAQQLAASPIRFTVGRAPRRIAGESAGRVALEVVAGGPCQLMVSADNDPTRGQLVPDQGTTIRHAGDVWAWSTGGPELAPWGTFEACTDPATPADVPGGSRAVHPLIGAVAPVVAEGPVKLSKASAGGQVLAGTQALWWDCDPGATVGYGNLHVLHIRPDLVVAAGDEISLSFAYRVIGAVSVSALLTFCPTAADAAGFPRLAPGAAFNLHPSTNADPWRTAELIARPTDQVTTVLNALGDIESHGPATTSTWQPLLQLVMSPYDVKGQLFVDQLSITPTACAVTGQELHT